MAIPSEQMHLRYGNVALMAGSLVLGWEVYHPGTQTVIESGSVSVSIAKPGDYAAAWLQALNLAGSAAATVYAKHAPNPAIGGYSLFDADLILDGWLSDPVAGTLAHPLCGTFSGVSYSGIVELVNAVLARVAGPPSWFWARPVTGGIQVKSTGVTGATVYYVYDGTVLLGNVTGTGWQTVAVPDGSYSVRMAGVVGGQVGVCSFPVSVTVGMPAGLPSFESMVVQAGRAERAGFWARLARWFRDPFGVLPA